MHVCVRVQTADCSDKRGLVTRRIKASQMLQSIVCAFRSIAGAATADALIFTRPCLNNRFQLAAEVVYYCYGGHYLFSLISQDQAY